MNINTEELQKVVFINNGIVYDNVEKLIINNVVVWTKTSSGENEWVVAGTNYTFTSNMATTTTETITLPSEFATTAKIRVVGRTYSEETPFDVIVNNGETIIVEGKNYDQKITLNNGVVTIAVKGTTMGKDGLIIDTLYGFTGQGSQEPEQPEEPEQPPATGGWNVAWTGEESFNNGTSTSKTHTAQFALSVSDFYSCSKIRVTGRTYNTETSFVAEFTPGEEYEINDNSKTQKIRVAGANTLEIITKGTVFKKEGLIITQIELYIN